jgi:Kef-type K+ transport system membrane component KefB
MTHGVYRVAAALRSPHVLGAVSIALCLALAAASSMAGLAALVGAYAAGLLLDDVIVRPFGERGIKTIDEFVSPIVFVFGPVFFVRTGMSVQLAGFGTESLLLTALLVVAAVVGKLMCGLGARGAGIDKLMVGIGMTPRGEVGLIFAAVAATLHHGGKPLLSPGVHAALVVTVLITTVLAPPALAWRIRQRKKRETVVGGSA